ncbi:MAG: ATP-binding protein, partial [Candidatus Zixiibacteriota bacterium]
KAPNRVPIGIIRDVADNINIMADPLALGRAIDAVLENAVKYNDSPQVELRVSLKKTDGKAKLTIKDNGIGFNPKEHEAIFERFYRIGSELTRKYEGTGLGLYLSREIIRAHGGKIQAHSDGPGTGAEVTITLKAV